jgi:tetratricopeptide (TPR) repeat protein
MDTTTDSSVIGTRTGPPQTRWRPVTVAPVAHVQGWRPTLIAALVAVATFVAFSPAIQNAFVAWDDEVLFTTNEHYRGLGGPQLRWMFTTILMGHYVPITWLTHGLDYVLWGMDPAGYHLTNVVVHAANAALFYFVALRLLAAATTFTGSALHFGAAVSALFFALHPLRAESVAWVTERRDVLSAFFFLLTLLCYLRAGDIDGPARVRRHAAACVFYVLAMLSKSMVMTLPAVLILLDVYPFRRLDGTLRSWLAPAYWREKLPYLALGALAAMLGYYAQAANAFITNTTDVPLAARPALIAFGLWFYASKTFLPTGLSPLYELPPVISLFGPRFIVPVIGVPVVVALLVVFRRRWPAGLTVAASYVLLISPVVGIVHSGYQMAHDRYGYLACLGWALLVGAAAGFVVAAAARRLIDARMAWIARAAFVAWLGALGLLTWYQVQVWKNTSTLWQYALDAEPDCTVCLYNQGALLYNTGRPELAKAKFERIMAVRPDRARALANLALAHAGLGDLEQAANEYRKLLARIPDDIEAHNNLGALLTSLGRPAEAAREFRWAIRLEDNPMFRANLALALLDLRAVPEALAEAELAVARKPDMAQARFALGLALRERGDLPAARRQLEILRVLDTGLANLLGPAILTEW